MMTMTTMADGLDAQDSSKSAFMEFGQQQPPPQPPPPPHSQQSSPAMAGAHYPLHCLHSAAGSHPHHQHHHHSSPYSGTGGSYNHRSLAAYPYVSHSQHSPYLQSYHTSGAPSQTRPDDAGERGPALRPPPSPLPSAVPNPPPPSPHPPEAGSPRAAGRIALRGRLVDVRVTPFFAGIRCLRSACGGAKGGESIVAGLGLPPPERRAMSRVLPKGPGSQTFRFRFGFFVLFCLFS